jgi:hypothetical protein
MKQAFPNLRIRIKVIPRFFRWYACHGLVFVGLLGGSTVATAKRRADTRLSIPRQLKRSLKDLREAGSKRSREIFQNVSSVRAGGSAFDMDQFGRPVSTVLGFIAGTQTLGTILTANKNAIFDQVCDPKT